MDDPVLEKVLEQLSDHDLRRARASSERDGDHDLVAQIERHLREGRTSPPVAMSPAARRHSPI